MKKKYTKGKTLEKIERAFREIRQERELTLIERIFWYLTMDRIRIRVLKRE